MARLNPRRFLSDLELKSTRAVTRKRRVSEDLKVVPNQLVMGPLASRHEARDGLGPFWLFENWLSFKALGNRTQHHLVENKLVLAPELPYKSLGE